MDFASKVVDHAFKSHQAKEYEKAIINYSMNIEYCLQHVAGLTTYCKNLSDLSTNLISVDPRVSSIVRKIEESAKNISEIQKHIASNCVDAFNSCSAAVKYSYLIEYYKGKFFSEKTRGNYQGSRFDMLEELFQNEDYQDSIVGWLLWNKRIENANNAIRKRLLILSRHVEIIRASGKIMSEIKEENDYAHILTDPGRNKYLFDSVISWSNAIYSLGQKCQEYIENLGHYSYSYVLKTKNAFMVQYSIDPNFQMDSITDGSITSYINEKRKLSRALDLTIQNLEEEYFDLAKNDPEIKNKTISIGTDGVSKAKVSVEGKNFIDRLTEEKLGLETLLENFGKSEEDITKTINKIRKDGTRKHVNSIINKLEKEKQSRKDKKVEIQRLITKLKDLEAKMVSDELLASSKELQELTNKEKANVAKNIGENIHKFKNISSENKEITDEIAEMLKNQTSQLEEMRTKNSDGNLGDLNEFINDQLRINESSKNTHEPPSKKGGGEKLTNENMKKMWLMNNGKQYVKLINKYLDKHSQISLDGIVNGEAKKTLSHQEKGRTKNSALRELENYNCEVKMAFKKIEKGSNKMKNFKDFLMADRTFFNILKRKLDKDKISPRDLTKLHPFTLF